MNSIAEHYDQHLAEHYSWLFGGLPERVAENRAFFEAHAIKPTRPHARALDIGAGSGFQSIPLAELGFDVTAVDLSQKLLAELRQSAAAIGASAPERVTVHTVRDDILRCIPAMEAASYDVCVCMGDTLTHLGSFGDVQRLLRDIHRVTKPGGSFVVALRDLTGELHGEQRFIPVRADEHTVFSCFLEYEGDHVRVYDVIHRRSDTGWDMRVSSYKKLRIAPDWLEKRLADVGFTVSVRETIRGLATLVAQSRR